jgi:hypothetical protein
MRLADFGLPAVMECERCHEIQSEEVSKDAADQTT